MTLTALAHPVSHGSLIATPATPGELIAEFTAWLELAVSSGELSRSTATTYRQGLRRFTAWLEAESVASVGPDELRSWRSSLLADGAKPSSVNVWLSGVRAFYAWACERGRLAHNPAASVKGAKRAAANKRHSRDALTSEEAARLLELPLSARDGAIVRLMLYTGARSVEVSRARVEDIVSREGELVLLVQGKGRSSDEREELVLVHPAMQRALMAWLTERGDEPGPLFTSASDRNMGGELSLPAIRAIVKGALRAAGIVRPGITTHSLRHTSVTQLLRRGGSLRQAQTLARHASPTTTAIYAHELARIADAPERLIDYGEPVAA